MCILDIFIVHQYYSKFLNLNPYHRNKSRPTDELSHSKENEDQSSESSPLSTRSLRGKYVRKPLHEYGKTPILPSPHEKVNYFPYRQVKWHYW